MLLTLIDVVEELATFNLDLIRLLDKSNSRFNLEGLVWIGNLRLADESF